MDDQVRARDQIESEEEENKNDGLLWLVLGAEPHVLGIALSGSSARDAIAILGLVNGLHRLDT